MIARWLYRKEEKWSGGAGMRVFVVLTLEET